MPRNPLVDPQPGDRVRRSGIPGSAIQESMLKRLVLNGHMAGSRLRTSPIPECVSGVDCPWLGVLVPNGLVRADRRGHCLVSAQQGRGRQGGRRCLTT